MARFVSRVGLLVVLCTVLGALVRAWRQPQHPSPALHKLRGWALAVSLLAGSPAASGAAVYPDTVLDSLAVKPAAGQQLFGLKGGRLLQCAARSNCVSTSSIKSVEKYARPWSFEGSAEEAFDRLVSTAKQTDTLRVEEADKAAGYVHLTAKSSVPPTGVDDVEFLINAQDKLITFRSNSREVAFAGPQQLGDRGSNRNRLVQLQRKLGLKDMGDYGSEYFENQSSGLPFDGLLPSANLFKYQSMANEPDAINFMDNKPVEESGQPSSSL